jgi:hypothetical protein
MFWADCRELRCTTKISGTFRPAGMQSISHFSPEPAKSCRVSNHDNRDGRSNASELHRTTAASTDLIKVYGASCRTTSKTSLVL